MCWTTGLLLSPAVTPSICLGNPDTATPPSCISIASPSRLDWAGIGLHLWQHTRTHFILMTMAALLRYDLHDDSDAIS